MLSGNGFVRDRGEHLSKLRPPGTFEGELEHRQVARAESSPGLIDDRAEDVDQPLPGQPAAVVFAPGAVPCPHLIDQREVQWPCRIRQMSPFEDSCRHFKGDRQAK
jgi:hypothetical protein